MTAKWEKKAKRFQKVEHLINVNENNLIKASENDIPQYVYLLDRLTVEWEKLLNELPDDILAEIWAA